MIVCMMIKNGTTTGNYKEESFYSIIACEQTHPSALRAAPYGRDLESHPEGVFISPSYCRLKWLLPKAELLENPISPAQHIPIEA